MRVSRRRLFPPSKTMMSANIHDKLKFERRNNNQKEGKGKEEKKKEKHKPFLKVTNDLKNMFAFDDLFVGFRRLPSTHITQPLFTLFRYQKLRRLSFNCELRAISTLYTSFSVSSSPTNNLFYFSLGFSFISISVHVMCMCERFGRGKKPFCHIALITYAKSWPAYNIPLWRLCLTFHHPHEKENIAKWKEIQRSGIR